MVARGEDLAELFENAGKGMTEIMADVGKIAPTTSRNVYIEAEDRETLLVEWLNEALYLTETEGLIFGRFEIDQMSDTTLSATIAGEPFDEKKHDLKTQVKAVTYHNLKVEKKNGGWTAHVIFDV